MQVSFAMLKFLAKRPDGWATLDELIPEVNADESEVAPDHFSGLNDMDAIQAGLVVEEADGLRISETGRSVLRALEALANPQAETERLERWQSFALIDDLIGPEMRQKIFDLDLRGAGADIDRPAGVEPRVDDPTSQPELKQVQIAAEPADTESRGNADDTTIPSAPLDAPTFLTRDFGEIEPPARASSRRAAHFSPIASNLKRLGGILRGHIELDDAPDIKTAAQSRGVSGLVLSVLVLLILVICAGTVISVTQIKALKSEITTLERQLVPLKKQAASIEQPKNDVDQKSAPSVAAADKGRQIAENRAPPPSLILSADEVRLVREYIKPAPFNGPAALPINVGDLVTIGTIPLPSALMDKVPKLLGARFTIRNGAIIILKPNSRQADAVVGPN